jgi:hypothetical protein
MASEVMVLFDFACAARSGLPRNFLFLAPKLLSWHRQTAALLSAGSGELKSRWSSPTGARSGSTGAIVARCGLAAAAFGCFWISGPAAAIELTAARFQAQLSEALHDQANLVFW